MNLEMVERNSIPEEFACIWQSKWVGIITIETEKNVSSLFMRRFRGCQLSRHIKLPNIYEGVIDASVNTCCKLKLVFLEKCL